MARFSLLVCLLAFYLVSCKLSISSAFRQLNALLRFFHISFFLIVMKHWQIQRSKWTKQVGWVGQSTSFFCWYWGCLKLSWCWFSSWLKQQRSSRCRGLARCWMFEWQGCRLHHGALRPSSVIAVLRIDCPLFCPPPGVIIIILSLTEPLPEIQNINCV